MADLNDADIRTAEAEAALLTKEFIDTRPQPLMQTIKKMPFTLQTGPARGCIRLAVAQSWHPLNAGRGSGRCARSASAAFPSLPKTASKQAALSFCIPDSGKLNRKGLQNPNNNNFRGLQSHTASSQQTPCNTCVSHVTHTLLSHQSQDSVTTAAQRMRVRAQAMRRALEKLQPNTICIALLLHNGIPHRYRFAQRKASPSRTPCRMRLLNVRCLMWRNSSMGKRSARTLSCTQSMHRPMRSPIFSTLIHLQVCELFRRSFVPRSPPELCLHGRSGGVAAAINFDMR